MADGVRVLSMATVSGCSLEKGFCLFSPFLCTLTHKCLLFPGNTAFSVLTLEVLPECNKSDCVYVEEMKHITIRMNAGEALREAVFMTMTTVCTCGFLFESTVPLPI